MLDSNPYTPPAARVYVAPEPEIVAATRWERFRAALVDGLLIVVPPVVLSVVIQFGGRPDFTTILILGILTMAWVTGLCIWNIVLLVQNGQTLGKKVVGIRVIDSEGENPGFWKIFLVRWLPFAVVGGALDLLLNMRGPGALVSLVDVLFIYGPTRRCLHDMLADTHVIRD
jgi:uncharacterized RDD family membrane protein YckC